ncbi:hypothetical protein L2E82_15266 [Cichorium intybus]|uniref:Uncharacterized protein n=1 Tax=Cichorium intybus TaxID=13427 RepID=A0ACB9F3I0_CICIN|nr:hypothetical protein L2E82_15266 [Cichorium intybus]
MRNPSRPAPTLRYFPGLPSMPCDTSRLKNSEWRVARRIYRSLEHQSPDLKNDQAFNVIRKNYETEKQECINLEKEKSEKAILDMEKKCEQKLSQCKEESEQQLLKIEREHIALRTKLLKNKHEAELSQSVEYQLCRVTKIAMNFMRVIEIINQLYKKQQSGVSLSNNNQVFTESIDLDTKDRVAHKHTPYILILVKMANEWAKSHNGKLPTTTEEKKRIQGSNLKRILDDTCAEVDSSSSDFWVMVAALKEFIANEGGGEPHLRISRDPFSIPKSVIKSFCKNARKLTVCRYKPVEEESSSPILPEMQKYLTDEEYSYSDQRSWFRLVKRVWFCTIFYPAAGIESMDRKIIHMSNKVLDSVRWTMMAFQVNLVDKLEPKAIELFPSLFTAIDEA